ncbi:MAG: formylglycine-generating enzyme family protein [Pirellulaceae bacterium]
MPEKSSRRSFLQQAHMAGAENRPPWSILSRRDWLGGTFAAALWLASRQTGVAAHPMQEAFVLDASKDIIPAPNDAEQWPEYRRQLAAWREAERLRLHYEDTLYQRPDFAWVANDFACCFLMMCDQTFYDSTSGRYTVQEFLKQGQQEFGGYDSVVLWQAYPRIGLDSRNQFDFYRDMPGGLTGLRTVVDEFHRQNVRVFIDYNPWDTGTRREDKGDLEVLCDIVRELDVDGIFLDTMSRGAPEFRAMLDRTRPGVALEGEIALPLDRVHDHHLSWAQWFADSEVPGVLRNKWFERRHMQHQIRRWDFDHSAELQTAWMNGSGMMVWENVFGSWMGWCQRDRATLRTVLAIQRQFPQLWQTAQWTPLVPTLQPDVYANLWEDDGVRLWTLVNRSTREISGPLLSVDLNADEQLYDLAAGKPIQGGEHGVGRLGPRGIGCLLAAVPAALGGGFSRFLEHLAELAQRGSQDTQFPKVEMRSIPPRVARVRDEEPLDLIRIPGCTLEMVCELRERECGFYDSNPAPGHAQLSFYEFRLKPFPKQVVLADYRIGMTPVTNAQYHEFLRSSGYEPAHRENFLRHWVDAAPPPGKDDHPVVYVDVDDARAYAAWAGNRLPTEEEWQYAAQGPEARRYPWGDEMLPGRCNAGETGDTTPVKAFPDGRSPRGIWDLCGNVWEWTESQRSDGRTRFCILKGGSYFAVQGSMWYMDGGPRPNQFSAKFLQMWAGLDRCATIGFRCAADE